MDGTLLDPSSRVSALTADILNPLIDRGLMFTVATARTPATVEDLMTPLHTAHDTHGESIPAIVMTGAALWDLSRHEFLELQTLTRPEAEAIADAFRHEGIEPFVYCRGGKGSIDVYHPTSMSTREDSFYQERRHLKIKKFHIGETAPADRDVILFFAMGDPKKMDRICRRINVATRCAAAWYLDIFNPEVALMDVYAPGCSKANAVNALAEKLGCQRTVVFGDNLNDLPMMRVANLSVAVENALPQVKEEADVVIGSNIYPSVAEFIRRDFDAQ